MARAGADGQEGFGWGQRVLTEKTTKSFWKCVKNSCTIDLGNVVFFWKSAWGVLKGYMSSFFWAGYLFIFHFYQRFVSFLSVFLSVLLRVNLREFVLNSRNPGPQRVWKVSLSSGSRHRFQWQIPGPQWQIPGPKWQIMGPKTAQIAQNSFWP